MSMSEPTARSSAVASSPGGESRIASVRKWARWTRRLKLPALLFTPLVIVWLVDFASRGRRIAHFDATDFGFYLLTSLESLAFWAALLFVASARRGWARHVATALAVFFAGFLIGGQHYVHDQYATYVNLDAARYGAAVESSVGNYLKADAFNFASHVVPPAVLALALILLARRFARPRRKHRTLGLMALPAVLVAVFVLPCPYQQVQAATPDVLLLHAVGRVAGARVGLTQDTWSVRTARVPVYMPRLFAEPARPRNIVLVVDESVRADVVCMGYDPACETTPFSNAAAPGRIPLRRLHAVDSTTALSLAVLWSGLSLLEPPEVLHDAPLLFDFAHAGGLHTGYVTSQNLDFADSRSFVRGLPLDRYAEGRDFESEPHLELGAPDEAAAQRVVEYAGEIAEPFFLVLQLSNVHYPYRSDPQRAPFQPATQDKDPSRNHAFFNHYKNAVHLHDRALGLLVNGLRALPSGERTVIIYTSDHGEAFREHDQLGHTLSIFEEEIHVPGWIDAPPEALAEHERQMLQRASDAYTWHSDIAPTILDLMGVWDAPEVARFRERMIGTSLLRGLTTKPMPITNCTALWECSFRNWGMMHGSKKLEARAWDSDWHCFDIVDDPSESHDLGSNACGDLAERTLSLFGKKPGD